MTFRYADLFCGIGGFTQAAHRLGGELVAACEIDEDVRDIFARNYKLVPHDDIRTMPPVPRGRLHLVCAGFPCQPFSYAGERLGTQTENGQLFFSLLRFARESAAPCLLLENVAGLLSIEDGRTFREFVAALEASGYHVSWAILRSQHFGLPQLRKRLYIVAHRERKFDFRPVLEQARRGASVPAPPRLRPYLDRDLEACRELAFPHAPFALPPRRSPSGLLRCDFPHSTNQTHRVYHPDGPMPTLISSNPTKIYDPRLGIVRKLSAREMLRCQGFSPRTFRFPEGLAIYLYVHMCGNAVAVPVVEAVLREIQRQGLLPEDSSLM